MLYVVGGVFLKNAVHFLITAVEKIIYQ